MGNVTVVVPPSIRHLVGGRARVPVQARTVRGALDALTSGSDSLRAQLFDRSDKLNRFVRVFVDGESLPIGSRAEEKVDDGAVVTILLALAGG
ncbi:MAG TPA: MoaD/ThiS family protein [Allosphingosinicella sp.]|nr:MoaD/ThiS family protein [Allosphingosinicella sp.]